MSIHSVLCHYYTQAHAHSHPQTIWEHRTDGTNSAYCHTVRIILNVSRELVCRKRSENVIYRSAETKSLESKAFRPHLGQMKAKFPKAKNAAHSARAYQGQLNVKRPAWGHGISGILLSRTVARAASRGQEISGISRVAQSPESKECRPCQSHMKVKPGELKRCRLCRCQIEAHYPERKTYYLYRNQSQLQAKLLESKQCSPYGLDALSTDNKECHIDEDQPTVTFAGSKECGLKEYILLTVRNADHNSWQ